MTEPTNEEIKKEIEAGEKFSIEHPSSTFGDDNVADFETFKNTIERFQEGDDVDDLETEACKLIDVTQNNTMMDTIDWLKGEGDPPYTGE